MSPPGGGGGVVGGWVGRPGPRSASVDPPGVVKKESGLSSRQGVVFLFPGSVLKWADCNFSGHWIGEGDT